MISRRNLKAGVVLETLLILLGLGLLIRGCMIGASNYRFANAASVTEATVIGVAHYGFTLDIQLVTGQAQSFVFQQNTLPLGYNNGDQVEVYYNLDDPYRALMANFTAKWFDPIALVFAGFVFAGLGFGMRSARSI